MLSSTYENLIFTGKFNAELTEVHVNDFLQLYDLDNLIKEPTCFKNPTNPSCIDLILTNRPRSFQNSTVIGTGLSDFHRMTLTVMKMYFEKPKPHIVTYRDYRNFSRDAFQSDILNCIGNVSINEYKSFHNFILETLDKHTATKKRYVTANQASQGRRHRGGQGGTCPPTFLQR